MDAINEIVPRDYVFRMTKKNYFDCYTRANENCKRFQIQLISK